MYRIEINILVYIKGIVRQVGYLLELFSEHFAFRYKILHTK